MLTGQGLKKVAFVASAEENNHWMLKRLLKRARGLELEHFFFIDRDDPDLNRYIKANQIKALIPLGEGTLRRMVGESDILRWRGRVVKHQMGIFMIPTFKPSDLLPQKTDIPGKLQNPPRYQGCWMLDVLKAIEIAEHGFTRRSTQYLLDPEP